MTSSIFQFLLDFAEILCEMSKNLWLAINEPILGVPAWALLGSAAIVGVLFVDIIKAITK